MAVAEHKGSMVGALARPGKWLFRQALVRSRERKPLMRHLSLSVTLLAILLATGAHAQTPSSTPTHPPVVAYNPANWKEVTPAEGGFTISMPGQPTVVSGPLDPALPSLVMHFHLLATDLAEFGVVYVDFPVKSNDPTV